MPTGGGLVSSEGPMATRAGPPSAISDNDFWGIRDLVLVGYDALFIAKTSAGAAQVKAAAVRLAQLLPEVHPSENCRSKIGVLVQASAGAKADRDFVVRVAAESWACLPAKFTEHDFKANWEGERAVYPEDGNNGGMGPWIYRMPGVKDEAKLGACRQSSWPRACSYWAAMHHMAYRADVVGKGRDFLHALMPILGGGATFCNGCTEHLRMLHRGVLTPEVMKPMVNTF